MSISEDMGDLTRMLRENSASFEIIERLNGLKESDDESLYADFGIATHLSDKEKKRKLSSAISSQIAREQTALVKRHKLIEKLDRKLSKQGVCVSMAADTKPLDGSLLPSNVTTVHEEEPEDVIVLNPNDVRDDETADVLRIYSEEDDKNLGIKAKAKIVKRSICVNTFRVPPHLTSALKEHQKEALKAILEQEKFLLTHSMGLGKTLTALAAIEARTGDKTPQLKVIIACPKAVRDQWYIEYRKWEDVLPNMKIYEPNDDETLSVQRWDTKGGVLILHYEKFQKLNLSTDFLIVDEAHNLKNSKTKLHESVCRHTGTLLLLTGTPYQNHLKEYFTMICVLDPNLLNATLMQEYDKVFEIASLSNSTADQRAQANAKMNALSEVVKPYVHRRSSDFLFKILPPCKQFVITYNVNLKDIPSKIGALEKTNLTLEAAEDEKFKLAKFFICTLLKETNESILVFSQRKNILARLSAVFSGSSLIDGTVTDIGTRQRAVNEFQSGSPRILFMTTMTGSVGLNLQKASRVLMLDPTWNPVYTTQAVHRAFRFGQDKQVFIYRFMVANSIESRIYKLSVHKSHAASRINDGEDPERFLTLDQIYSQDLKIENEITRFDTTDPLRHLVSRVHKTYAHIETCGQNCDELTEKEKEESLNERNKIAANSSFRAFSGQILSHDDIYDTNGSLIPPLAPWYKSKVGTLVTFGEILPFSSEIVAVDFQKEYNNFTEKVRNPVGQAISKGLAWHLHLNPGEHRVRVRYILKDNQTSEWSDWSAQLYM